MKSDLAKNGLIFLVIILFVLSSVLPVVFGTNSKSMGKDIELMNLAFICREPNGFNELKYEYYKKQLLKQNSDEDIKEYKVSNPKELLTSQNPLATTLSDGPIDSPWPMYCHDARHTGRSPYITVDTCAEKWRFRTVGWASGSSVIDNDGVIYIGSKEIYAINPNGTLRWKYDIPHHIESAPAIDEDGIIYIGTVEAMPNYLYALYPNGTLKWKYETGSSIYSSPCIDDDGIIYFGDSSDYINALYPNGTLKWRYKTDNNVLSSPAIGEDGIIYCGSHDNHLYALYSNGTLKWKFKTEHWVRVSPCIADDGTIYVVSLDNYLYAVYPNDTLRWKTNVGAGTSPTIAQDGTIYAGYSTLYAIYPTNGSVKWTFNPGPGRKIRGSTPCNSIDGTIYFGTNIGETSGGEIIAVNPDGTEKWRKMIANDWVDSAPSIAKDGTVYIGSSYDMGTGYLYAFGIGELKADADGPYYGLIDESLQFTGSHWGGYSPHTYHWNFGDGGTSEEQNPIHTYTSAGNYTVTLTVTDNSSNQSSDTTWAWIQTTNSAPYKPNIDGPTSGEAGTSYDYTFSATDPDGSIIYLYIEWDDDSKSGWIGPFDSGKAITKSHTWSEQGTYIVKAKAKDPYGEEGLWGYLEVTMPVNVNLQNLQSRQQSINPIFLQVLQRLLNIR